MEGDGHNAIGVTSFDNDDVAVRMQQKESAQVQLFGGHEHFITILGVLNLIDTTLEQISKRLQRLYGNAYRKSAT